MLGPRNRLIKKINTILKRELRSLELQTLAEVLLLGALTSLLEACPQPVSFRPALPVPAADQSIRRGDFLAQWVPKSPPRMGSIQGTRSLLEV